MIEVLLQHKIKKSARSFAKGQSIISKLFVGIIFILFGINLLFTAFFLQSSLFKDNPIGAIDIVNANIIYYFLYGIVIRLMFQKSVFVNAEKYLHLPISKNSLVHFLLLQSFSTLFNFLPLFFTIPFALVFIEPSYNLFAAFNWVFFILTIDLSLTLIVFYINKGGKYSLLLEIIIFVCASGLLYLSSNNIISFNFISNLIDKYILEKYYGFLISIATFFYIYRFSFLFFKNRLSLDYERDKKKKKNIGIIEFDKLKNKGIIGHLLSIELKLIFRNKRPRNVVAQILIFIPLGFMILLSESNNDWTVFYFLSILINAIPVNYGSMMFGWESKYYESLNRLNLSLKDYIRSKYTTLTFIMIISYIMVLPFCILNSFESVIIGSVLLYFSIGILIPIVIYLATFNRKRVDLSASLMSQQGKGGFQYIVGLLVIVIPNGIFFSIKHYINQETALIVLSVLGFLGIAFSKQVIMLLERRLHSVKYKMIKGFRENL